MPGGMRVLNIKASMPTVEEARRLLLDALRTAKADGVEVLKVIHGYGSSGVGGALRTGLRRSLSLRRKEGAVREVIYGERWDIFEERTQALLQRHPALRRDQDLNNGNEGITLVIL